MTGYKRPPRDKQLRPGVSGNPGGRPKARKASPDFGDALYRVLARKVALTEGNKSRKIYVAEGILINLAKSGVRGDIKAILALIKLLDWFPVSNEDLREGEMNQNADKVRHKIEQM